MLLRTVLALSLFPTAVLAAQTVPMPPMQHEPIPTISSSASATAKFSPDRATISIAVQTKAPTAAAAGAENARKQNAVMSALRGLGLTNQQLSTTGYSVSPEYRYDPKSTPTLIGYTVTNTVLVDIHDLTQIGKVLDTALANGSNMISSLDFYANNTDTPRQQALSEAVAKARADAEVAAKAAGGTLGALVRLNVGGGGGPYPIPQVQFRASAMASPAPPTQINPGEQTIAMSVSGDWRFIPNR